MLRSFSFSENSPAPASPCLRDVPSPASLVFTPAQCVNCESGLEKLALEGSESDLEKFDESQDSESEGSESEGEERRKTERVKVLRDYEAVFSYELTIRRGDLIDLVNDDDKRWWKGKVGGKEGYFPAACVEKV